MVLEVVEAVQGLVGWAELAICTLPGTLLAMGTVHQLWKHTCTEALGSNIARQEWGRSG